MGNCIGSLELWNRICEESQNVRSSWKISVRYEEWKQNMFMELVNCIEAELQEGRKPMLAAAVENKMQETEIISFSLLLVFRAVWSFQRRPVELVQMRMFLDGDYMCNKDEVLELKEILSALPRKYTDNASGKDEDRWEMERFKKWKDSWKGNQKENQKESQNDTQNDAQKEIQKELEEKKKQLQNQIEELDKMFSEKKEKFQNICAQYDRVIAEKEEEYKKIDTTFLKAKANRQAILDEEIRKEKEQLQKEVYEQVGREKAEWVEKAKKEVEQAKAAEIEKIRSTASYQLKKEENERYLKEVREDILRRMEFENRLCDNMRGVSWSFKSSAESMMEELTSRTQEMIRELSRNTEKTVEELRRNAANAANAVVETERKIRRDDGDALLHNFCELQEQLFYNVPEEQLGLKATQIEKYLKRFLKVLNRMGYEHFIPEPGTAFEDEFCEEGEAAEFETEKTETAQENTADMQTVPSLTELESEGKEKQLGAETVAGVIHYGFKKEGDVCMKAKVTVQKR